MSVLEPVIATCQAPRCPAAADVEAPGEQARLCAGHGLEFLELYPEGTFPQFLAYQDRVGLEAMRREAKTKAEAKAARYRAGDLTEAQLLKAVKRWADQQDDLSLWRENVGSFELDGAVLYQGEQGLPDLVFEVRVKRSKASGGSVVLPIMVRVELKTATGSVSRAQKRWHERSTARGGLVRVCRSLLEVQAFIDEVRKLEGLLQLP